MWFVFGLIVGALGMSWVVGSAMAEKLEHNVLTIKDGKWLWVPKITPLKALPYETADSTLARLYSDLVVMSNVESLKGIHPNFQFNLKVAGNMIGRAHELYMQAEAVKNEKQKQ